MTNESTRQLPGVKGQWILAADCPPTEADVDVDGEVRTYAPDPDASGDEWRNLPDLGPHDYWCPADHADPRPFCLSVAPADEEAARLVAWLRANAEDERQVCESSNQASLNLDRTADLLTQYYPAPAPPLVTPRARTYDKFYPADDCRSALAIASDGSAWRLLMIDAHWTLYQLPSLPDRQF
jgi:hypothetical protein